MKCSLQNEVQDSLFKNSLEFKNKQSKNNKGSNNPMFGKSTKKKYTQEFINKLKEEYKEKYEEFYETFCSLEEGNASQKIVERIWK